MGNKNTTTLFNNTDEVLEIRVFRGLIAGEGEKYVIESHQQTKINGTKYDEGNSLMIFCDGRSLLDSSGELVLPAEKFFNFKTVTIGQSLEDQNSTGVVNYEVKLEPQRGSSVNAKTLKFSRDQVLGHDYDWSVQFINGSVKLTRKEGVTMILDPSKLFATINHPEISLLHVVLRFWPRTFADLNRKVDLVKTVGTVNNLMVQAKAYNARRSNVQVAEVMENVSVLNELCAAKVEWYRPLFPGMEKKFPPVEGQMAEDDKMKLKEFETTILRLLATAAN